MPQLVVPALATGFGIAQGKVGYALLQIGVGLAFNVAGQALLGDRQSGGQEQTRDLFFPVELPPARFIYGETRATATVLPHPVVGEYGFGVYLLNSRPSVGTPVIYLDGREIPLTGDAYDFEGAGAVPSSGDLVDHLQVWIGTGDQDGPPDEYVAGAPYDASDQPLGFRSSDAGTGLTVVYLKYRAGASPSQRWPSAPPRLEVEGLQTAVWDPRDPAQDAEDETTWLGTSNHGLNTLDALRNNPFRPYDDKYLLLDHWEAAADIADVDIPLAAGGSEKQWTVDGTLIFDGTEIETMLAPLLEAGAAQLIRVGGKLGIAPGAASDAVITMTTMLDGLQFSNMAPSRDLPTQMRTTYVAKNRGFAEAELAPWDIPGVGEGEDLRVVRQVLRFTTSATRAQRLRRIRGLSDRQQRRLGGVLPPEALDLVIRSGVDCVLGPPYADRIDGAYEVAETNPFLSPLGDEGGMALRVPVSLRGTHPDIWAWSIGDEEEVFDPPYEVVRNGVQVPGALNPTTGSTVNLDTGGGIQPRILLAAAPSPSAGVTHYEWQGRIASTGDYGEMSGQIDGEVRNGSDKVFWYAEVSTMYQYDFRLRAWTDQGASEWVEITGAQAVVGLTLTVPTLETLVEAPAGTVTVTVKAPNDDDTRGVQVAAGLTTNPADAVLIDALAGGDTAWTSPMAEADFAETGLGSGVTRYYFTRGRGQFGAVSDWSAPESITTS